MLLGPARASSTRRRYLCDSSSDQWLFSGIENQGAAEASIYVRKLVQKVSYRDNTEDGTIWNVTWVPVLSIERLHSIATPKELLRFSTGCRLLSSMKPFCVGLCPFVCGPEEYRPHFLILDFTTSLTLKFLVPLHALPNAYMNYVNKDNFKSWLRWTPLNSPEPIKFWSFHFEFEIFVWSWKDEKNETEN